MVHISLLKPYHDREESVCIVSVTDTVPGNGESQEITLEVKVNLTNSAVMNDLPSKLFHLPPALSKDVCNLIEEISQLVDDVPHPCDLVEHDMVLQDNARPVKQAPYRVCPSKKIYIRKEVVSTGNWLSVTK